MTRGLRRTAALATLSLVAIAPLIWMVNVSLMPKGATAVFPPPFWPSAPTLANYRELLLPHIAATGGATSYHIGPAILNSTALAMLATVLGLAITLPAGYAFAKLKFVGRAQLLQAVLALAVMPAQVAMLPLFLLL